MTCKHGKRVLIHDSRNEFLERRGSTKDYTCVWLELCVCFFFFGTPVLLFWEGIDRNIVLFLSYYIDRVCLSWCVETVKSFPVLEVYALIFLQLWRIYSWENFLMCTTSLLLLSACVFIQIFMQSIRIFCPIHTLFFGQVI